MSVLVVGYVAATAKLRLGLEALEGKTETITRGDLTVPINATGEIRSLRRVVIKAEASGEVIEIAKQPGDRVALGDLLVRLQPDDEKRSVNRAELDLAGALARREESRIILEQAKTADLALARANVAQIEANLDYYKYRALRIEETPDLFHDEERLQRVSAYKDQLAKRDSAKANLEKAAYAVQRLEQSFKQATAAYETFQNNLGDAQKRLAETDIISPLDGIVAQIRTQIGEVIQGGKTTITGGTELAVVIDMDNLIVRAEVDEADIGRVLALAPPWAKPGRDSDVRMPEDFSAAAATMDQLPSIRVEAFRDEEFFGVIARIHPEPTSIGGVTTFEVDVVIVSENRGRLLPGMRADVRFTSEFASNVVLCPNEAIREGPGGKFGVYVPKPGTQPEEREVEFVACDLGLDNGNYSEVRKGLDVGMVVYTRLPSKQDRDKNRNKRKS